MQSEVRFTRVPKNFGEGWVQSQVRFNRVLEKVPEKVSGGFGAEPGQVQQGSGEGSGEGLGGFGAEPGQVQRGPEKVPEKVPRNHGAKPSQVQRVLEKGAEKIPEKVLGILGAGPGQVQQVQQGFQRLASQHALKRFVKIRRCDCWGYRRSLFSFRYFDLDTCSSNISRNHARIVALAGCSVCPHLLGCLVMATRVSRQVCKLESVFLSCFLFQTR